MKKVTINSICLVMLGNFYRCTSGEMQTPQGDGLIMAQDDTTEVLHFKDSAGDLHEVATADLVTNRSFANAGAANAALGAGKLWFNTTSKAIAISE